MPEFKDPVFAKTSLKGSFSIIENERFGLVFAKTRSMNSGSVVVTVTSKEENSKDFCLSSKNSVSGLTIVLLTEYFAGLIYICS